MAQVDHCCSRASLKTEFLGPQGCPPCEQTRPVNWRNPEKTIREGPQEEVSVRRAPLPLIEWGRGYGREEHRNVLDTGPVQAGRSGQQVAGPGTHFERSGSPPWAGFAL